MKRILKYLILFILALAFHKADVLIGFSSQSTDVRDGHIEYFEEVRLSAFIFETEQDSCIPRQVSFAYPNQIKCNSRRTDNSHRQNSEFIKSGKVVNPNVSYISHKQSTTTFSSFSNPAYLLSRLCIRII